MVISLPHLTSFQTNQSNHLKNNVASSLKSYFCCCQNKFILLSKANYFDIQYLKGIKEMYVNGFFRCQLTYLELFNFQKIFWFSGL